MTHVIPTQSIDDLLQQPFHEPPTYSIVDVSDLLVQIRELVFLQNSHLKCRQYWVNNQSLPPDYLSQAFEGQWYQYDIWINNEILRLTNQLIQALTWD